MMRTMKEGCDVVAAREQREQAASALAAEQRRVDAAGAEIASLTAQIGATDPDDDPQTFAKLIAARDAARGRREALELRVQRAERAHAASTEAAADAERRARKARVAELDAELGALDATVAQEVDAFYRALLARIAEARRLAAEANSLDGAGAYDRTRGSRWAAAPGNKGALRVAIGVLPDESPDREYLPTGGRS
jgi:hypothetical protein